MGLTLLEQETVITFNREEREAEIYTFDPKLIRIFTKFANEYPMLCGHVEPKTEMHAHVFVLDRGLLRIHPKRMMSDEEKVKRAEMFKKSHDNDDSFSANTAQEE